MPDPAYKFETPVSTHRRLNGWFRGTRVKRENWDRTYSRLPSDAAGGRAVRLRPVGAWTEEGGVPARVVDVGCGRGVDDLWLARQGASVIGFDYALRGSVAIAGLAADEEVDLDFRSMNLCELRSVLDRERADRAAARAAPWSPPGTSPTPPTRSAVATSGGPAR